MIHVSHIFKSFGSAPAVDDLSFDIKQGEIVGLLGPNGAGKTTTMRMLTGFLTPDRGEITVDGMSVLENPIAAQEQIGYLPENNPLYKDMLVGEFLSFCASLRETGSGTNGGGIDFAVKSTNIGDVFYRPIGELSKGYKQRVGLAATLLHRPKVIIMDEPTEGLDPNQRSEIRTLILDLAREHTILMSTHVMQEVEAVASRMIIINRGKLIADGTPRDLVKKAGPSRIIHLEVEGKSVETTLRGIAGVKKSEVQKLRDGRVKAVLTVEKNARIQPDLCKAAARLRWTIWKLAEEEKELEDVFHSLTQGGSL